MQQIYLLLAKNQKIFENRKEAEVEVQIETEGIQIVPFAKSNLYLEIETEIGMIGIETIIAEIEETVQGPDREVGTEIEITAEITEVSLSKCNFITS